ncbi:hypothetical protein GCM10027282_24170 [Frigoribacterium salinisoli]
MIRHPLAVVLRRRPDRSRRGLRRLPLEPTMPPKNPTLEYTSTLTEPLDVLALIAAQDAA